MQCSSLVHQNSGVMEEVRLKERRKYEKILHETLGTLSAAVTKEEELTSELTWNTDLWRKVLPLLI